MSFKVGIGYDVHKLVPGRDLIIGGVKIDHPKGLLGHSDADVLLHAIADAILGAAAKGDIGKHFPPNDLQYKGLSGTDLLSKVVELVSEYQISNIDSTVILQEPHISEFIPEMRKNIAKICNIDISKVSVKATTTDFLGYLGRAEGAAAQAIVLLI